MTRRMTGTPRFVWVGLMLLPALAPMMIVFSGAMTIILVESFKVYIPGRIVQPLDILTFSNYTTFVSSVYLGFFGTTFRLAVLSALISVFLAYPLAYKIARSSSPKFRKLLLILSILTFFLSGMVRVVSLVLLIGSNGVINSLLVLLGLSPLSLVGTETGVLIGMVHFQLSIATLALVGAIVNIDPAFEEAARGLGASGIRTFLAITLPLSMPGVLAAAMLSFAVGVSAFTMPLFLGRGLVNMISNLIYDRFAEVLNFPEGSALAVILLCAGLVATYFSSVFARMRGGTR